MEVDRITPHEARVIQPLQDHEGGTHVNLEPTAIESEQSERTRRLTLAGDSSYGINPSKFGGTGPPFDCTMSVQACSLLPSHLGPRPCLCKVFHGAASVGFRRTLRTGFDKGRASVLQDSDAFALVLT